MTVANAAAPQLVSIDLRPPVVAEGGCGDWKGDLVIGAGQKQALVTRNVWETSIRLESPHAILRRHP